MRYGYFDDQEREYVITTPETPYPWINYLGTGDFISLISNTGGGYCFYKDARQRRLIRYRYNNVPLDYGGRYYYISEDGDYWSPGWIPVQKDLDFYQCRHGLGYSLITGERKELRAEILFFVPRNADCELHRVKLENRSSRKRNLKLFSLVEFALWDAYDDMTNFQRNLNTAEVEVEGSTIFHKTEYRERRNHYAFFSVNSKISGYDTDRESLLGLYRGFHNPEAVSRGRSTNSLASGWAPVGSHSLEFELAPGEVKTLIFQLGYIENPAGEKWRSQGVINKSRAYRLIERYNSCDKVEKARKELREYWDRLTGKIQLTIPDKRVERMVNIWNQYQCLVTFNLSRSASYFESGVGRGIGFRDSNQDLLGVVQMIPERTRERLINLAQTQFADGSAFHQYQPLTGRGNDDIGTGFYDDPLWLIMGTSAYLKETGDLTLLKEAVPFNNGEAAVFFDHLKESFFFTVEHRGPHGLPQIGRADWNDCLNLNCFSERPGESFQTSKNRGDSQAESIMIGGLFITIGVEFVKICRLIGQTELAAEAEKAVGEVKNALFRYGTDPNWFIRAYDYYGNKVGSLENKEGQLFIEPQGFCIMAGLGLEDGLALRALDAVKERLDTEYGLILLDPAYQEYHLELGEVTAYPPGYKENGGIFCHTNPWIMIAETMIGRGEQAFAYYQKICPAYLEEISGLHRTEPYVYCQMIAGRESVNHGEAKNSWLTGTAAWNFVAITQWILGIRPDYGGLTVDPCIPADWNGFRLVREFRGKIYDIEVDNTAGVCKGVSEITVNGQKIRGKLLPLLDNVREYRVEVVMG